MDKSQDYLLVVEDIPDILNLLDTTLKFKGYRVVTARNGEEALEAIESEHPALIITDILMPKMDGFSLVHRLRIDPQPAIFRWYFFPLHMFYLKIRNLPSPSV